MDKVKNIFNFSLIAIPLVILISTVVLNNNAIGINQSTGALSSLATKEYAYTFKVADKLSGTGEIAISLEKNKIKGSATGIGSITQCNIDFYTNLEGNLNTSKGIINVSISGTGNPIGIPLPGKITFKGPLEGCLDNDNFKLIGKVNIKGGLARFAGFNKTEDLLIEIPDPTLLKTLKQIQAEEKLAFLN